MNPIEKEEMHALNVGVRSAARALLSMSEAFAEDPCQLYVIEMRCRAAAIMGALEKMDEMAKGIHSRAGLSE